jgi:hypothetical protein
VEKLEQLKRHISLLAGIFQQGGTSKIVLDYAFIAICIGRIESRLNLPSGLQTEWGGTTLNDYRKSLIKSPRRSGKKATNRLKKS